MARLWVYDRTSGDEKETGQDVRAQAAATKARAEALGHVVIGTSFDDGVSGDVPPLDREGFLDAAARVAGGIADAICIREASRFSRCHPAQALLWFDELSEKGVKFVCLKESDFTTLDAEAPEPTTVLVRFIALWQSWATLEGIRSATGVAMREFKLGRRATKSGRPVGRPEVALAPEHLAEARRVYAEGGRGALAKAHRAVLAARGWDEAKDPATKRKRYVGRETVARALGLRPEALPSAHNHVPPKMGAASLAEPSAAKGPVVGGAETGMVAFAGSGEQGEAARSGQVETAGSKA